jgi:hypothetical protein
VVLKPNKLPPLQTAPLGCRSWKVRSYRWYPHVFLSRYPAKPPRLSPQNHFPPFPEGKRGKKAGPQKTNPLSGEGIRVGKGKADEILHRPLHRWNLLIQLTAKGNGFKIDKIFSTHGIGWSTKFSKHRDRPSADGCRSATESDRRRRFREERG